MLYKLALGLLLTLSLINAQMNVSKQIRTGWNMVSIPVSTTTSLQTLFSDEADGSLLWKFDGVNGWQLSQLTCNNGCSSVNLYPDQFSSFDTLEPMDGFWIHSPRDFVLNATIPQNTIDISSYPDYNLTQEELYALAYMWHEEKLAYDIYMELYKVYPLNQLQKIATNSEITHIQAVESLVEKYDINITNLQDYTVSYSAQELAQMPVGVFAIESIQNLYDVLYAKGITSQQDALEVGCMVEVTDVNDLDEKIAISEGSQDLVDTFSMLREGSYNHYWAFDKGLKNLGVSEGCCALGSEYCKTAQEYPSSNNSN